MKLHEITVVEEASRCLLCYDAPCSKACPAASDPASFIMAIRFDNRSGGARQALGNNLFGGICAAVCPSSKYCEGACIRGKIDSPVNISMLHSYIAQYADENDINVPEPVGKKGVKVLVLGANLSGIAAAAMLAENGIKAEVFADSALFCGITGAEIDGGIIEHTMKKLKALGVVILESKEDKSDGYGAVIVTTKKALEDFPKAADFSGVFFTGELVAGPNDAAYSVKKGKQIAGRVLEYLGEAGK